MQSQAIDEAIARVENISNKSVVAFARIPADCLKEREINLKAVPEESKYRWHADIIGWPTDKARRDLVALKLAERIGKADLRN